MTNQQTARRYLDIGDVYFIEGDVEVWTVLGSCVSILLYSVSQRCGVICHAQLPMPTKIECDINKCNQCPYKEIHIEKRFLGCALKIMLEIIDKKQIARSSLEACVFGGANVLHSLAAQKMTIGERNASLAIELLKRNNIKIKQQVTGGNEGYKIIYNNNTRSVTVNRTQAAIILAQ